MPRPDRIEPILMMRPCRCLIIGSPKAREQRNAPVMFTSVMWRHSSSGMSASNFGDVIPALLNKISARPNSASTRPQACDRKFIGDVGLDHQRALPCCFHGMRGCIELADIAANEREIGAGLRQRNRRRLADATSRAGD